MLVYILRRLLLIVPTLLALSFVIYCLLLLKPGDPIDELRFTTPGLTQEDYDRMRAFYALDRPWYVRYGRWLERAVHGDFGPSRQFGRPAAEYVFKERLPNTLTLSSLAIVLALVVSIPAGMVSAIRQHTVLDYGITFLNFIGVSIPVFWTGIMLIYLFAVQLKGVLPAGSVMTPGLGWPSFGAILQQGGGFLEAAGEFLSEGWIVLVDRLRHLILPVVVLSTFHLAQWTRFMRSVMLDVIHADYVVTARSKGLTESRILYRHAFRNAVAPLITLVGVSIPQILSGALLTETVFNWPGMGRAIYESLWTNDYNVAMVSLLFIGCMVIVLNVISDIACAMVDPRIRY